MIGTADSTADKQREVPEQAGYLRGHIAELEKAIDQLEGRLVSALRSGPPTIAPEKNLSSPFVPLASDLCGFSSSISRIRDKVASILERLEL